MAKGANYDPDEVHAVVLAGTEVAQGKQASTEVLHGMTKAAYERHCAQLGVAPKQRTGQNLWDKYKSTRKEIVNTITPVYNNVVNTDGSIPSGKSKSDVEKEVLDALYTQSLNDDDKKDEEKRAALLKKTRGLTRLRRALGSVGRRPLGRVDVGESEGQVGHQGRPDLE
jgi:hypothetical protein